MNHLEDHADGEMTRQLRDSLSGIRVPGQPALDEITSRGRAHRRHSIVRTTGVGVASVAAGSALTLGLIGGLGGGVATSGAGTTVRETAFTLTANSNGTDTLTLNKDQVFDPAALQQALVEHGIPALVDIFNPGERIVPPAHTQCPPAQTAWGSAVKLESHGNEMIIDPAAIPAGMEVFFGYYDKAHIVTTSLLSKAAPRACYVPQSN